MVKLIGYRGRDAEARAHDRSNESLPQGNTYAVQLADGSLVGGGATLLMRDGSRDSVLYGARGTSCLRSEAVAAGLLPGGY